MTMTGVRSVIKEDGVTPADPFDRGGGRLEVPAAANAGLLLDETTAGFENANPVDGGDPSELNLATLANNKCLVTCTWERTFTSALAGPSTWTASVATTDTLDVTISPSTFTIPAGGSQTVVITANVSDLPFNSWVFGDITFSAAGNAAPDASLPLAVTSVNSILPDLVELVAHRNVGGQPIPNIQSVATNDLTVREYGLVPANELTDEVDEDSDNSSVYDDHTDGTLIKQLTVPAGAVRLVAETYNVEAIDADLFVVRDANNDGVPEESEEVCRSASASAVEYCDILNPEPGAYIVIAQNWEGSANQPDLITLATGVVPATDMSSFDVTGPSSVPGKVDYSLQARWNLGNATEGDRFYGAFDLGSSANAAGDLGLTPVNLVRGADEITKSASSSQVTTGQYVTYTIAITNYADVAQSYNLTDTLPAGLTIDPASLTGGATYHAASNSVRWSGMIGAPSTPYIISDSRSGGPSWPYLDVAATATAQELCSLFPADDGCDEGLITFTLNNGTAAKFYNTNRSKVRVWTNGFLQFSEEPLTGNAYYVAQNMPNSAIPNSVFAGLWTDLDLDGNDPSGDDTGGGKIYANTLSGVNPAEPTAPYLAVQYKNAQQYDEPTSNLNFNLFARIDGVKSEMCAVYGPTLTGDLVNFATRVSVGLENDNGTQGQMHYHSANAATAANLPAPGTTICAVGQPPATHTITFRALVTGASTITNNVTLTTAGQFGQATSQAVITAVSGLKKIYMPRISR
jgi:uncharacterized repeat protein (TIGR01451 family)